jgi:hypothetical protein
LQELRSGRDFALTPTPLLLGEGVGAVISDTAPPPEAEGVATIVARDEGKPELLNGVTHNLIEDDRD